MILWHSAPSVGTCRLHHSSRACQGEVQRCSKNTTDNVQFARVSNIADRYGDGDRGDNHVSWMHNSLEFETVSVVFDGRAAYLLRMHRIVIQPPQSGPLERVDNALRSQTPASDGP